MYKNMCYVVCNECMGKLVLWPLLYLTVCTGSLTLTLSVL